MSSQVEKKENNIVELHLDFSVEEFKHGMDFAYKKNAKRFNVPGFRPGKAPMSVAIRYYGEGVLYDDAVDHVISHAYGEAIEEHKLEPVSQPQLSVDEIGLDKGLKVTLQVTVKPEVQLGKYKGVEAVKPDTEVKESDITAELDRIRERNSRLVAVEDRAIEDGDTANIDYEGQLDGVPFDGGKGEAYDLRIGSKSFIPGFEEQLIGKNIGDDLALDITFPENYHSEDLKGKAVVFNVHVNGIKVKELPELDDEFAKDVSEFDTLEEYKNDIRVKQQARAEESAEAAFENAAIDAATDNASVEIPAVMIENELDQMMQQQDQQMRQQGFSLEQYLGFLNQDLNSFREQGRAVAERRVKTSLVLDAIASAEAFEISDEELEAELLRMSESYKMELDELKKTVTDDAKTYIKDNLKIRKAIDTIKETALPITAAPVVAIDEKPEEMDI